MITNQRGIALVVTLLVVALLTITVIEFTYSVQIDQHMAHNALSGLQASLLARSGINLGEAFLLHDDDEKVDAFTEGWCPDAGTDGHSCLIDDANGGVLLPQNMRLRVQIVDEGGKLNLNLVRFQNVNEWSRYRNNPDPKARQGMPVELWKMAFERLLQNRGLPADLAGQVLDYWDGIYQARYPNVGVAGAGQTPGVPTPPTNPTPDASTNAQMQSLEFSSLDDAAAIPGMTPSVIRKLRPVLTALPSREQQRINANTAPLDVLRAAVDDEDAVNNIVSLRSEAPMKQNDLTQAMRGLSTPATGGTINYAGRLLGVQSSFYQVRASGVVNPNPVTGRGGISRSASMLVRRIRRAATAGNSASAVPWTLTQLDWQKEGGAALFQPQGDQEQPGTDDDRGMAGSPG